jgi:hypothetical protein
MRLNVGSDFADEYIRTALSVVGETSPLRSLTTPDYAMPGQ